MSLPLGIMKQGCMKLDSFIQDMREANSYDEIEPDDREKINKLADMACLMEASIINIVKRECDEDDFINEQIEMDQIDAYPDNDIDLLDQEIE
jgi:hypothetical protein